MLVLGSVKNRNVLVSHFAAMSFVPPPSEPLSSLALSVQEEKHDAGDIALVGEKTRQVFNCPLFCSLS